MVKQEIFNAVSVTMEEMFFLEVGEPRFQWARVRVEKPFDGAVTLAFPQPLIEDVASAIMPGEERFSDQQLQDALAELVNTVAGRVVSDVVSPEVTFKLSIPETGAGWPVAKNDAVSVHPFQVDRKCFIVVLEGAQLAAGDWVETEVAKED